MRHHTDQEEQSVVAMKFAGRAAAGGAAWLTAEHPGGTISPPTGRQ